MRSLKVKLFARSRDRTNGDLIDSVGLNSSIPVRPGGKARPKRLCRGRPDPMTCMTCILDL